MSIGLPTPAKTIPHHYKSLSAFTSGCVSLCLWPARLGDAEIGVFFFYLVRTVLIRDTGLVAHVHMSW